MDFMAGVNLYPQLNLSYTIDPSNMLQVNFSSDKKYPAYWAMSSNVSYLNVYSQVRGNPYLEPERIYMARANYILKKKYVFGLFANHQVNYIRQLYYQDTKALRAYYQSVNFDKQILSGRWQLSRFGSVGRLAHGSGIRLVDSR